MLGATALALAAVTSAIVPPPSAAAAYELTVVFDYTKQGGYVDCPAISGDGAVAFQRVDVHGNRQVVRGDEDELTVIAKAGQRNIVDFDGVALNDAGEVAIVAVLADDEYAVFRGDGSHLDLMATTAGTDLGQIYGDPSIDEHGVVAFTALRDDYTSGVYTVDKPGGTPRAWYVEDPAIGGVYSADMAGGSIVFRTGGPTFAAYRSDSPGQLVRLTDDDETYGDPAITTKKRVALGGYDYNDLVGRIAAGKRPPLRTYYDSAGSDLDLRSAVTSINQAGTVAFSADYVDDVGSTGVYIGNRGRPVLQPGDKLGGKTVGSTRFCKDGLNDAGQVAFAVSVVTGTTIIVRANPT